MKTQQDLKDAGATLHHMSLARGYVSRKAEPRDLAAELLTRGPYAGMWRVKIPNWDSTRYCFAAYYEVE